MGPLAETPPQASVSQSVKTPFSAVARISPKNGFNNDFIELIKLELLVSMFTEAGNKVGLYTVMWRIIQSASHFSIFDISI